jgi:hypothetical protein
MLIFIRLHSNFGIFCLIQLIWHFIYALKESCRLIYTFKITLHDRTHITFLKQDILHHCRIHTHRMLLRGNERGASSVAAIVVDSGCG